MERVEKLKVQDAQNAFPRDITRFKTLYPNGEAELRPDAGTSFYYLSSMEMVAEVEAA
jgi:hypothetical protein